MAFVEAVHRHYGPIQYFLAFGYEAAGLVGGGGGVVLVELV